ncbi:TrkA C-terminal domain-containing protein [Dapis sp. BLCC M126]|uniref:TrkA C-terminal domain-containing protein n=1 Tax=Dapis sp. BLCC M126 TaxID=3400189 RepID=UPI003CF12FF4
MGALISLFIAVSMSLLITHIAATALTLTGLSQASAKFQARSAFTGSGFTTKESEKVVNHPVRRRIIMLLMFTGNAGVITVISSLVLTFISDAGPNDWLWRSLILILGVALLWAIATNRTFNRFLTRIVKWSLRRWTKLEIRDYASLLHLRGEYQVMELLVSPEDWLANKRLDEVRLRDEGITILGIERSDGTFVGIPKGSTCIFAEDILILYGRRPVLSDLDSRLADIYGEEAHQKAVADRQKIQHEQDIQDEVSQEQNREKLTYYLQHKGQIFSK